MFPPLLNSEQTINCPHFGPCSGCTLSAVPSVYWDAKIFFEAKQFFSFKLHSGSFYGWRCRVKLAVRGTVEKPLIGLFREGSHQVVDIPLCQVHHPKINAAINIIKTNLSQERCIPYQEENGSGDLRYLQCVVERKTERIQLTLVCNHDPKNFHKWEKSLQMLWERYPELWHSIWLNYNTRRDNVIFGKHWHLFAGEPFVWERFGGKQSCFHPASFAQANFEMFEKMLTKIKAAVPNQAKVVEFYAGVGVIGLALVDNCQWVRCCEINPIAQECFEEASKQLPAQVSAKMSFHNLAAVKGIHLIEEADTIIVDPPRKGLDIKLLQALQQLIGPKQLIYISCNWKSFQKDFLVLTESLWKLKEAEAYLFFPGSNHIELLAIFEKESR